MKRKLLILVATVVMISAASYAQISFGVRAGVNLQNINGKDDAGDKLTTDLIIGFNAGVNVELPIAQDFYLQPGLLFSTKGAKSSEEGYEGSMSIAYLELPIHLVYKPQLGNGKLILGFGPYVGYGIMGKVKPDEGDDLDIKFKNKVTDADYEEDYYYVKALDAGADIFFGYEFASKLSVQLNAQLGLLSMIPGYEGDDDSKAIEKNTGFGISLGYRF